MQPLPRTPPLDFALLQQTLPGQATRSRRTLWWLLSLLLLLVASVVALVLYLNAFEQEEEQRRRVSDGQWLEQSVRFHFLRLEEDLRVLARQTLQSRGGPALPAPTVQGGLLWNQPGAVRWHGWQPRPHSQAHADMPDDLRQARAANAWNDEALASMLAIAVGLRRSSYAGPLRDAQDAPTDTVWLAVPYFERGEFLGNYLASLSMQACVEGLVPAWFHQTHRVGLASEAAQAVGAQAGHGGAAPYLAAMNLPGTDMFIKVAPLRVQPAMVPRIFLVVALLFLTGMLGALYALRLDFLKRQRIERALQAQVALRTAMENAATIGLRAWDRQGRILYVNRAFCRMVGFEPAELLGRSAPLPYWPAHQAAELDLLHRDVIAQGTEEAGVEVQFQHKSGQLVDVLIHEAPLNSADGQPLGWMSSVLDISERKRAERSAARQQQKLEASGRLVAMGEVASTLAHELNQPLGALSGFANGLLNRLRQGRLSDAELIGVVERMEQLSAKSGRIIQRVSAFARRREMSRQPLQLGAFVRRVVEPLQRQRPTVLELALPVQPLWIEGDALLLEHALLNLVSNAEYWAAQGVGPARVRVRVRVDVARPTTAAHTVALVVEDSGPGVPPDQRDQVFNAFFSGKDDGMGMGLAICRSVVEAHHGHIEVGASVELGGASFRLSLPLIADADAAEKDAPVSGPGALPWSDLPGS